MNSTMNKFQSICPRISVKNEFSKTKPQQYKFQKRYKYWNENQPQNTFNSQDYFKEIQGKIKSEGNLTLKQRLRKLKFRKNYRESVARPFTRLITPNVKSKLIRFSASNLQANNTMFWNTNSNFSGLNKIF